jgi:hypothetical protein
MIEILVIKAILAAVILWAVYKQCSEINQRRKDSAKEHGADFGTLTIVVMIQALYCFVGTIAIVVIAIAF